MKHISGFLRIGLTSGLMIGPMAYAQPTPEFEVATIKPSAPDARGVWIRMPPGDRVDITNMTLKELIVTAWSVQPFQVSGGPPWLESLHFDISAKAETAPKRDEMLLLLRALLKDRFQLEIRMETKEMPVYAIVQARKDGKLGPQMKESTCTPYDPQHPPERPAPGVAQPLYCGNRQMGPAQMKASGVLVADLAPMLGRMLGRTVIDKSGLTAKYDLSAQWTPDEQILSQLPVPAGMERPTFPESGPSIFTAFQEQLGLKLESQKGPVEILVVEKAEKPSEN
jgi:uncharacterized protein (TIGR03435 family)